MSNAIAIYSGKIFDLNNPEQNEFTITDIAHALSQICRFTGHCTKFYSVAQHSVYVSRLCPPHLRLHGLLHDAAEAFIGDVSSPLKRMLPDYKAIEARIEKVVLNRFGLSAELPPEVKEADMRMLATERLLLVNSPVTEEKWAFLNDFEVAPFPIDIMNHAEAKKFFLIEYLSLRKGTNLEY